MAKKEDDNERSVNAPIARFLEALLETQIKTNKTRIRKSRDEPKQPQATEDLAYMRPIQPTENGQSLRHKKVVKSSKSILKPAIQKSGDLLNKPEPEIVSRSQFIEDMAWMIGRYTQHIPIIKDEDSGIDILVKHHDTNRVILIAQCHVDSPTKKCVRELFALKYRYQAERAIIFTHGLISEDVWAEANFYNIRLVTQQMMAGEDDD